MHKQYLLFADETTHFKCVSEIQYSIFFPFQDSKMYIFLNMIRVFSKASHILRRVKGRLY